MKCLVFLGGSGVASVIVYQGYRTEHRGFSSEGAFQEWYYWNHVPFKSDWRYVDAEEYARAKEAARLDDCLLDARDVRAWKERAG